LETPELSGLPGGDEIWAVGMVRDEADIVGSTVGHLLQQGVDHVLIADHGSTDGTLELLDDMARRDDRIHVVRDHESGYFQREKMTRLSQLAWLHGAEWIVPFDADEFWFAETQSVAEFLRKQHSAIVKASVHNLVPMGMSDPINQYYAIDRHSTDNPKVAFRAHPMALIWPGNHAVIRTGDLVDGLRIAHLPYRSSLQIDRKFRTGVNALDAEGATSWIGVHWRRGVELDSNKLWSELIGRKAIPSIGWKPSGEWVEDRVLQWKHWNTSEDSWITNASVWEQ
jgi:hypothetical protein